jgi:hypothetical protein
VAEVLELGLDARPMEQGAAQAKRAIDSVSDSALKSQAAISKAFQTTGGAVQVAGGIAQTAKAFSELNVAAGAFGASRALLEIGKTAQDFRELSARTQEVTRSYQVLEAVGDGLGTRVLRTVNDTTQVTISRWATLGTILRAHPLMTLVTVLSTIGGLMSVFSSNTKEAANSFDQLAAAMQKAKLDASTRAYLGLPQEAGGQQQALFQAIHDVQRTGQGMNLQQFGPGGLGGGADVARYLATRGTEAQQAAAREYMRTGGQNVTRYYAAGMQGTQVTQFERGLPNLQLSQEQTQEVLRARYRSLQPQEVSSQMGVGTTGISEAMQRAVQSAAIIATYKQREADNARVVAENMERAANYAGNIGSTVGAAFADVLMKTTTLRQAFAGIVASIARQGLADIGASIFRGAVSGLTPTQSGANAGVPMNTPGGG